MLLLFEKSGEKCRYAMNEKASVTVEDYLGVLFILQRDGEPIVGARLAELLGVKPPTVTNTLKRMARDGLLEMDTPQGTRLTEHGLEMARTVMRRHMLTEWMLVRLLDVSWSNTHSEAHQMEHTISQRIEDQLRTSLDDPQTCPHGNPLPGYEYISAGWTPLVDTAPGDEVIIRRIHEMAEENLELMQFFEINRLIPGARVQVLEVLPFNQTLTLQTAERQVIVGNSAAKYIFVEKG
jgi:DtxR family transcriptional regulator, Mn-dependent transcriptional regulator